LIFRLQILKNFAKQIRGVFGREAENKKRLSGIWVRRWSLEGMPNEIIKTVYKKIMA